MKTLPLLFASLLFAAPAPAIAAALSAQDLGESSTSAESDLAALRQRLADWRLAARVEAPTEAARTALLDLRQAAAGLAKSLPLEQQPAARELLADLQVEVLTLWNAAGDSEALATELMALRLSAADAEAAAPVRLAAAAALERSEVAALLESLTVAQREAAVPQALGAGEAEVIAQAVREAVQRGDGLFLKSLGSRALPELERLVLLEDGSPRPEGEFDPLQRMTYIDPVQAMNAAERLVRQRPTLLVKRGVVDALRFGFALRNPVVWEPEGETGWRLANPRWHELFNAFVEEPALDVSHLEDLLEVLIRRGDIPAGLQDLAVQYGPVGADSSVVSSGHRALAVRCLRSESAHVRADAVRTLANSADLREALPLFEDPSPLVREALARSLQPQKVRVWASALRDVVEKVQVLPPVEEAGFQAAFAALLEDASEGVWDASMGSWAALLATVQRQILPLDACARLVERAPEDRLERVTELALHEGQPDYEPVVVAALGALTRTRWDSDKRRRYLLVALQRLGDNAELRWSLLQRTPELGLSEADAARLLESWAYEDASWPGLGEAYVGLLERLATSQAWGRALTPKNRKPQPWAQSLTDGLVERVWMGVSKHRAAIDWSEVVQLPVDAEAAARQILNPAIAPEVKLSRLTQVRGFWGEQLSPEVLRALAGAAQEITDPTFFHSAFDLLPPDRLQDYLAVLLELPDRRLEGQDAAPAIADEWLLRRKLPRLRADTMDAILRRFPPEGFQTIELLRRRRVQLLDSLVESMVESGDAKYQAAIEAAAEVPRLQEQLVLAIGAHRRGDLFGLLTDVVRGASAGSDVWRAGLASVASFLDDRAMAFLLEHARETPSAGSREVVMSHLSEVKRWQEASERWERSQSERDVQRAAIARLVSLLDLSTAPIEARAEALRGLGLLGAAEELPRLIEALASPEEPLRSAAREAIERLHRVGESSE